MHASSTEHDPFSYEIVEAVALVPRELLVIEASDIDGDSDGSSLIYTLIGGSVSCYLFPYKDAV